MGNCCPGPSRPKALLEVVDVVDGDETEMVPRPSSLDRPPLPPVLKAESTAEAVKRPSIRPPNKRISWISDVNGRAGRHDGDAIYEPFKLDEARAASRPTPQAENGGGAAAAARAASNGGGGAAAAARAASNGGGPWHPRFVSHDSWPAGRPPFFSHDTSLAAGTPGSAEPPSPSLPPLLLLFLVVVVVVVVVAAAAAAAAPC